MNLPSNPLRAIPHKRCRPLLGTYVEISVSDHETAVDQAFETIACVQRLMSLRVNDSDLFKINSLKKAQALVVHPWTWSVLNRALEVHHSTQGAFDCSVIGDMTSLRLEEQNIVILTEPVKLDLGGIAKGFAVDQAIDTLHRAGVEQALVNAGGDLRVYGPKPILLTLRDPTHPSRVIPAGYLSHGAMATSASYFSLQQDQTTTTCALINPFTRQSICELKSYSVLAPNCMDADALTKALAVHQNPAAEYFNAYQAKALLV